MLLDFDLELTILCFCFAPGDGFFPGFPRGKTLRELTDMADELLAHPADGHALNFTFLSALRRAVGCYFEKVGSALETVSEVDYRRDFLLPVLQTTRDDASFGALRSARAPAADIEFARRLSDWDMDMERRLRRRLHEEMEEVNFIFRVVCHYEGADTATDALLVGLETIQGSSEDMVPEQCP
ncbi:hypothetical protein LIER_24616 [Lithospermum erythrorhizon]|uniref:Uncharacterized protein n=1 Tax=Lithospermum erythrorhizon TaxID=34254 RepID=A0AAV3R5Z9_LITER